MSEENMTLYNAVAEVPVTAQKTIGAGRLKGFTDINPMWRIKKLTEVYGPCGIGWYYIITDKRIVDGANGEKVGFLDIDLFVKNGEEWSKPIQGTGGSSFIAKEKNGLYTSDEVFKMALTDALSVACKALGFGANVYWSAGRQTKYESEISDDREKAKNELVSELKRQGINATDFAKEKGISKTTPAKDINSLVAELKKQTEERK